MSQFAAVFDFIVDCISEYLAFMNAHWYTQFILYTFLLGVVVSVIIALRR